MIIRRNKTRFTFRGFRGEEPTTEEVRKELESLSEFFDKDVAAVSEAVEEELTTLQEALSALSHHVSGLDDGVTAIRRLVAYQSEANVRFVALEERMTDAEARLTAAELRLVPIGMIAMWSGLLVDIPTGWALCDGTNSTPDMRDKFVMGAPAGDDPGGTGGAADHTHGIGSLSTSSTGAHSHSFTQGSNATSPDLVAADTSGAGVAAAGSTTSDGDHVHSITGTLDNESNIPPFYALAFIMKLPV